MAVIPSAQVALLVAATCVLLPTIHWVLKQIIRAILKVRPRAGEAISIRDRVIIRYERCRMFPWFFAWSKLRLDRMFEDLPRIARGAILPSANGAAEPGCRHVLDLGCGYGIAGSYLLESFPDIRIFGIDPNPGRVKVATKVWGGRGQAFVGLAPDFEVKEMPDRFDAVMVLDVIHYLTDEALDLTLRRIRARLDEGGRLIVRATMTPTGVGSLWWNLAKVERFLRRTTEYFRTEAMVQARLAAAGFEITESRICGSTGELRWFLATAAPVLATV